MHVEEIAAFFDVSTRTIERSRGIPKFNEAMERGRAKGRVSVRRALFKLAAGGNIAAAIFLAKNLLGWWSDFPLDEKFTIIGFSEEVAEEEYVSIDWEIEDASCRITGRRAF
jgi:hypothetical protein